MGGYAWVTLATNDSYSLGALVLAHSLKMSKTAHKLVVLITPAVSQPMREQLESVFDVVKEVDVLLSKDEAHLALMQRPELGITFTKIHCWKLVEFDKCVFLDADTLVVRNCDELFERQEFSAAPDVGWPDCFNSGVFVYKPSVETFNKILQFAVERGSFDGGDQGLLNQFFKDWATEDIKKHLPFVYNLTSVAAYSYIPAFKHYGSETRIVHFIGAGKPWLQQLDPSTRTITPTSGSEHLTPLLQQWWDIFCEKVHPNLNKNLESNNDGMSHPPVEACSNSLPIALTDDSQTPRLIEPCTPYREKDDFRQYNLPYQPFDVMGSSGELLNVEFLLASVVRPTPPEVSLEEQQRRDGEEMEEKDGGGERNQKEGVDDSDVKENKSRENTESSENGKRGDDDFRTEERTAEGEQQQQQQQQQQQHDKERKEQEEQPPAEPEQPPPPSDPFDYDSFFPDETCINNYLEQNVMTYQPYDSHHHHQQHENHHIIRQQHENHHIIRQQHENHHIIQKQHENHHIIQQQHENRHTIQQQQEIHHHNTSENGSQGYGESNNLTSHPQPPEDPVPSLPRFLTIPENDRRQSGNTETHQTQSEPNSNLPSEGPPTQASDQPPPLRQHQLEEKRDLLTKSKSMPYLRRYDVTEVPSSRSIWKSQPNVNLDLNKKYSMPKLKPILPRQNSLSKSVPSVMPKVTLYTEFLMSSEYKDPANLPKDKVGFVETLIQEKGQLRRSKSAADVTDKFGPLPYIPSPEIERPAALKKMPLRHLDNGLYDLSQCKRQMGNKPKAKAADRSKENNHHSLPALKPLVPPSKDKKSSTQMKKKRKSKELSPGDGGREKILRRAAKAPKERKRECKITPRNVSETGNGNNVDEILKKLREFSKNYQHFFEVVPQHGGVSTIRCKNATVQVDEDGGGEWEISEGFSKTFSPGRAAVSRGTQTPRGEKSERPGPAVDSEFRNFRNYVQEKSKTSQKGLLSIQDFVLKTSTGEGEVSEGVKVSSDNRGVWKRDGGEKVVKRKVDDPADVTVKRKDTPEEVERKTPAEGIVIDHERSSDGDEPAGNSRKSSRSGGSAADDSNGTVENVFYSTSRKPEEVESSGSSNSSPKDSKSEAAASAHSEEDIPESQSLPVISCQAKSNSSETGRSSGEVRESSVSVNCEFRTDKTRTKSATTSYSHGITPKENCDSKPFPPAAESPARQKNKPEKRPEEETHTGKQNAGEAAVAADKSNPAAISSRSNRGEMQEKAVSRRGREERPEVELGKPDIDTPRVSLVASKSAAVEVIEEMITKASLRKSQTSAPPRPTSRKARRRKSGPTGTRLANGNGPPDDSPDGTALPAGGKTCAVPGKPSPPSPRTPSNGNALPECHEDLKLSSGIAGAIAQLSLGEGSDRSSESTAAATTAHQEYLRRQNWETGNMDYMGRDCFDNIWSKICQTLEGKELEAEAAAVSPEQLTESVDSSATVPVEEARKTEPPPVTDPVVSPSTVLEKCPEYIETLPGGEAAAGPVEDDEMIFSKPGNGQPCLRNITGEDVGTEGSAADAKPPETSSSQSSGPIESNKTDTAGEHGKCEEATTPAQKITEGKKVDEKLETAHDEEKPETAHDVEKPETAHDVEKPETAHDEKKPEELQVQPEPEKVQCQVVAIYPPQQVSSGGEAPPPDGTQEPQKKAEECTTVAIPSPPITFPGAPFGEKDKTQSKRRPDRAEPEKEKFDPIPLPPPESPTLEPEENAAATGEAKDERKQKKGVFTKILEMVGVTPREKDGNEVSKSVFYDVEEAAPTSENEGVTAPVGAIDNSLGKTAEDTKGQTEEKVPTPQSAAAEEKVLPAKPEETVKEIAAMPPEVEQKATTEEATKPCDEPKATVEKPARNTSPKEPDQVVKDTIQVSPKSKSPSPKLSLPQKPPETAITMPTPPPQAEAPGRKNSALLKVEETILETPPVPEPPKEDSEESVKGRVRTEVEDIIGKAKTEVENRLQDRRSAEKEPGESSDLINTLKLMMGSEQGEQAQAEAEAQAQAQSPEAEVEELRVTSEEDRMRHKGEVVSSKLSDQILKAIPPPRRKAISEGSASTSAIPKPPPTPEEKSVAGETKAKTSKPSSIPVPPPRNRGKPTQPTPPKGKGKK